MRSLHGGRLKQEERQKIAKNNLVAQPTPALSLQGMPQDLRTQTSDHKRQGRSSMQRPLTGQTAQVLSFQHPIMTAPWHLCIHDLLSSSAMHLPGPPDLEPQPGSSRSCCASQGPRGMCTAGSRGCLGLWSTQPPHLILRARPVLLSRRPLIWKDRRSRCESACVAMMDQPLFQTSRTGKRVTAGS